jgi:hypothetical protein
MIKGDFVKVTLRAGIKFGEVTKVEGDIVYVMSNGTEYKFYQGIQEIEIVKFPKVATKWEANMIEQVKKYNEILGKYGKEVRILWGSVYFQVKGEGNQGYQASGMRDLIKHLEKGTPAPRAIGLRVGY